MNKGPLASQWEAKSVGENQSSKMSLLRRASLSSPKPCPLWPPKQSIRQSQDPEIDNKIQSREAVRQQDLLIAPANAALVVSSRFMRCRIVKVDGSAPFRWAA